jgi:hypothetical protein
MPGLPINLSIIACSKHCIAIFPPTSTYSFTHLLLHPSPDPDQTPAYLPTYLPTYLPYLPYLPTYRTYLLTNPHYRIPARHGTSRHVTSQHGTSTVETDLHIHLHPANQTPVSSARPACEPDPKPTPSQCLPSPLLSQPPGQPPAPLQRRKTQGRTAQEKEGDKKKKQQLVTACFIRRHSPPTLNCTFCNLHNLPAQILLLSHLPPTHPSSACALP